MVAPAPAGILARSSIAPIAPADNWTTKNCLTVPAPGDQNTDVRSGRMGDPCDDETA